VAEIIGMLLSAVAVVLAVLCVATFGLMLGPALFVTVLVIPAYALYRWLRRRVTPR
jgi:membrane protein implicated in regulation of membrane protease activity